MSHGTRFEGMGSSNSTGNSHSIKKTRRIDQELSLDGEGMMGGNNMMLYLVVGVAAVSMGVSIFLYKEVRKIKTDIIDFGKDIKELREHEQLAENTKSLENLEDKVNQLGLMIKHLVSSQVNQNAQQSVRPGINQVSSSARVSPSGLTPVVVCEENVCTIETTDQPLVQSEPEDPPKLQVDDNIILTQNFMKPPVVRKEHKTLQI